MGQRHDLRARLKKARERIKDLEYQREVIRDTKHSYRDQMMSHAREIDELRAKLEKAEAVVKAARGWLEHLACKGHHYHDGIPGDLMDAVECYDASIRQPSGLPDATGCYHNRAHKETGNARPARTIRKSRTVQSKSDNSEFCVWTCKTEETP